MNLVVKDALWQILGRVISAIAGFIVIKLLTPYLGPLRYGDYSTILKYFAIWSAFADFGLYVIALKELGKIKNNETSKNYNKNLSKKRTNYSYLTSYKPQLSLLYNKFVGTRFFLIFVIYTIALIVAYLVPAYTSNPFVVYGLPIGMLFSASFMASGITQLPLQIFWKMEQVSISLILARIIQITVLFFIIFVLFPKVNFSIYSNISLIAFLSILCSVLISGLTQFFYTLWQSNKYINFKPKFDFIFIKNILKNNRKYGLAYYLSSFHTLIVLILLSILFPTIKGFKYVGIRALALSLIEILLIIPSAIGNSLIHKIAILNLEEKKEKFGNSLLLVTRIGGIIFVNFSIFSPNLIYSISGKKFLTHYSVPIGSDFILPFLGIVLILSFIKQIFNYIFVSENLQNKLLYINLSGVTIGVSIGIPLISKFNLIGGIITQLFLEVLFVTGSILVAYKQGIIPKINYKRFIYIIFILLTTGIFGKYIIKIRYNDIIKFLVSGILLNSLLFFSTYNSIKQTIKNL